LGRYHHITQHEKQPQLGCELCVNELLDYKSMLNNIASGTMIPLALKQESIRLKGEGAYQWDPCVP
jgi:hypothetical protein